MPGSSVDRLLRDAINRYPALRRGVRSRLSQRLIMTSREARSVRESFRYVAGQLTAKATARYHLRASGLTVCLRHRTRDCDILREIFGGGAGGLCYEPPPSVARQLDRDLSLRVLDLGGNIGLFGAFVFSRWPDAQVTSYEPDPANARLLAETIRLNGLGARWRLVEKAVATRAGHAAFAPGHFADSHLAQPGPGTITVATADLFELNHDADLLKMDIEGAEWPILLDARLAAVRARVVLLEWHGRHGPEPDAHAAALRLLRGAGYVCVQDAGRDGETDVGVLWAWRRGLTS